MEIQVDTQSEKYYDDALKTSLEAWHLRFKKLSTSLELRREAYEEHLEMNEADSDEISSSVVANKEVNEGTTSSSMGNATATDGSEDDEEVGEVHEFNNNDVNELQLTNENSEIKHANALAKGLRQKFWRMINEEKNG